MLGTGRNIHKKEKAPQMGDLSAELMGWDDGMLLCCALSLGRGAARRLG